MYKQIKEVIESLPNSSRNEYLIQMALSLNKAINANYTFIARFNKQQSNCKTEVLVANGVVVDNIEYSLINTPCVKVIENKSCFYPKDFYLLYPKNNWPMGMNIQGYIGTPLINEKQEVIGIIVALFEQEISHQEEASALLQLFSSQISAALDQIKYQQGLEDKINNQAIKLSKVEQQLQITQSQLIESEKMSSLGNLVAGVSHEVNTPLGIAITTHSVIVDALKELTNKLDNQTLSIKDMTNFRHSADKALTMQGDNLLRAKKLISNFKKTAADQNQLEIEVVNIANYYQQVISTLRSIMKPFAVELTIICNDEITLATYPGVHAQILTNLINNTVKHGFLAQNEADSSEDWKNKITIEIKQTSPTEVAVIYQDNGKGVSGNVQQHIFEPFFTTAKQRGGTGLGMSIIYNLITQKLNGTIDVIPTDTGACFHYNFKESITDFNIK